MSKTNVTNECVFMTITDVKVYLNISQSAAYQLSRRNAPAGLSDRNSGTLVCKSAISGKNGIGAKSFRKH